MRIILASASPRRKELLKLIFPEFEIIPAQGEEKVAERTPDETVCALASQKAEEVAMRLGLSQEDEALLISADTVVSVDRRILGKPADSEDAKAMLRSLSGRTHQVYTGVALYYYQGCSKQTHHFYECTDVTFYEISDEEIRVYVATGEPLDKAGSYGIQGFAGRFVRGITGDYNNVVGLPVAALYQEVKRLGII